ncbi:hypothetical protein [Sporosalibacterium faouarense]|uniref:hypothetical protein n=1 Tax=Sporosalibacterium faouarense TaxID=516123 RepID=UPI00192C77B6|nr:hypothetical protein [Sporosalibacterium faouarense]
MNKKVVITLLIIVFIAFILMLRVYKVNYLQGEIIIEKRVLHNSNYSEKKIGESNLIIMVSNQSLNKDTIKINGFIDREPIFSDDFSVGDQHVVTYYYENLSEGAHNLIIQSEDGAELIKNVQIINDKTWVYITYWNNKNSEPKIGFKKQNKHIGID